jgi:hypothetical protein
MLLRMLKWKLAFSAKRYEEVGQLEIEEDFEC